MKRVRVALADDHAIVLDGLEQLFKLEPEFEVVARSTTAEAAVKALQAYKRGEGSLAYAARQAGISLREMIPLAYAHGLTPKVG